MFTIRTTSENDGRRVYVVAHTPDEAAVLFREPETDRTRHGIIVRQREVIQIGFEQQLREWGLADAYSNGTVEVLEIVADHSVTPLGWWVGYRTGANTHFDVNIIDATFYLCSLVLEEKYRNQGHGARLYELLETVAREFGCREIRQTPSGKTPRGEARTDYLLRRGWKLDAHEVYKTLTTAACGGATSL